VQRADLGLVGQREQVKVRLAQRAKRVVDRRGELVEDVATGGAKIRPGRGQ
jgi:hypothetical protein